MRIRRPNNPLPLPGARHPEARSSRDGFHGVLGKALSKVAASKGIRHPTARLTALIIGAAVLSLGLFMLVQKPVRSIPREIAGATDAAPESGPTIEASTLASLAPVILAPVLDEPILHTKELRIGRGDTLMGLLLGAGVRRAEAHAAIAALTSLYNPRRLRLRHEISLLFEGPRDARQGSRFLGLNLRPDPHFQLTVRRAPGGGFVAAKVKMALIRRLSRASGLIRSSLYEAAAKKGVPVSVLMELIRIYSWDVDFQRGIRPGDSFEVMYEQFHELDGRLVSSGAILFANLVLRGTAQPLYRQAEAGGDVGYFDAKGYSAQKPLMRTPINGARLSSGYGRRRHPILGYSRMHKGVDFAAPRGTPIYAAGKGRVVYRARNGAYGKYIRIRHNSEYATAYGHLKSFKRGVGKGAYVKQGQIIGYVGSTGRSTGPHLHYEILHHGRQVNPMRVRLPSGRKLQGTELARFQERRSELDALFSALPEKTILAQSK